MFDLGLTKVFVERPHLVGAAGRGRRFVYIWTRDVTLDGGIKRKLLSLSLSLMELGTIG